ncbi:metallophosphoesterase [Pseudophaeobacter sp.]|uniref:metallophosphoesterase n=1 Tax=Pseudophaeobacter sp. TaxID=1971739 RepID=UPI003296BB2C
MDEKIYAIGDIHGDLPKLKAIHARIAQDCEDQPCTVVHLGDLVDRREDSCGVVNYLMAGQKRGEPWVVIKGNHDRLFSRFYRDPCWQDPALSPALNWLHPKLGGTETLQSYGADVQHFQDPACVHAEALRCVPLAHIEYLENLPLYHRVGGLLFVHAGIRPKIDLQAQTEDDLLWIREDFFSYHAPHDFLVIHGHTIVKHVTHYGNRINVDTGAAWGDDLSVIVIENNQIWDLSEDGRKTLHRSYQEAGARLQYTPT